jgi:predicted enzyme related to lactoylglutathione lyase
MERVTGIGGIFFKAKDAENLRTWYREHLGIESSGDGGAMFEWRESDNPESKGLTIWSAFPHDTEYFDPSTSSFMVNYRVVNLDRLLEQLRAAGVQVDDRIEEYEYGRFAWATDPEGNRFELWEPR